MITEDYVSFGTAKLLKEKGFVSDDCFAFYNDGSELKFAQTFGDIAEFDKDASVVAPTLQMAMKWLREEHNIFISIQQHMDCSYVWYVYTTEGVPKGCDRKSQNYSYEQACEAAIKYCLKHIHNRIEL